MRFHVYIERRCLYMYQKTNSAGRMTTWRPFSVHDLFRFNNINLDVLTETVRWFGLRCIHILACFHEWPPEKEPVAGNS